MRKKKCITEVYSRVTGFFRPVKAWNKGKTAEYKDRKCFKLDSAYIKKGENHEEHSNKQT